MDRNSITGTTEQSLKIPLQYGVERRLKYEEKEKRNTRQTRKRLKNAVAFDRSLKTKQKKVNVFFFFLCPTALLAYRGGERSLAFEIAIHL